MNQLTRLFRKYPHLREQKEPGCIFEILLEDEFEGNEKCEKMFRDILMNGLKISKTTINIKRKTKK